MFDVKHGHGQNHDGYGGSHRVLGLWGRAFLCRARGDERRRRRRQSSTADAGQTSAEDAGAQATRDAIVVAPDANTVPDAMSAKQPEEAATHEAGPPDADQPDAAVPLCGGEATRCFDGTTVQTCESLGGLTSWGNFIACQGVCLNGACVACDPGGDPVGCTGCNGNAGTQTCGATGVWSPCSTSCSG